MAPYDESINDAHAEFRTMPSQQLLTLKISTPEPWVVYPYRTDLDDSIDTDNIKLAQYFAADAVDKSVNVDFVLNNLLVAGECIDLTEQRPPAGMQLKLVSSSSPRDSSDTLVMQNLGYWQLKGNPGVWDLRLAEGSSQDLYRVYETTLLSSRDLPTSLNEAQNLRLLEKGEPRRLIVRDFLGTTEQLRVRKQAGMEHVSLLDSLEKLAEDASSDAVSAVDDDKRSDGDSAGEGEAEESSIWSSIQGMLGLSSSESSSSSRAKERSDGRLETIHVFSLATGALYERFLKIMMTSVVKRTKNPVKFWLLGNFISPRFKKAIPRLAEALGFEYALVTYKWPYWLRGQTEKQRIIWGYKILFLDVIFPLDIPKVIYVDADQVVRADLKELWDMDLRGRPYGYTPFCSSRKETLGYQFWREGYWKNHLRGRPYHISALYVVDLIAFRRMMVGDTLRTTYHQLSADPNSLSNLDQDLPNYAQHQVPIFSLPQEWLWCESWCSDASKSKSKTIDLCNNPRFKEPKLDMARRVISGDLFKESWVELDEEIARIESGEDAVADSFSNAAHQDL